MEHYRPNGNLAQGYYCVRCGSPANMMGTGHGEGECESNPKLIEQLKKANPVSGKPRFRCDNPSYGR